jgi:hypothetical protein
MKKYIVTLNEDEYEALDALASKGKDKSQNILKALINTIEPNSHTKIAISILGNTSVARSAPNIHLVAICIRYKIHFYGNGTTNSTYQLAKLMNRIKLPVPLIRT